MVEDTSKSSRAFFRDISLWPEDIIHHTLSYLETKEAIKTSMFCKTWYNAWLTCPTLNFTNSNGSNRSRRLTKKLVNAVKSIAERYKEQKLSIMHWVVGVIVPDSYAAESLVKKLIGVIVKTGVQTLELEFMEPWETSQDRERSNPFPLKILGICTLTELTLRGSSIKVNKGVTDEVMFTRLHKLHFVKITINEDTFEGIISKCGLIENLSVEQCQGLTRIKVTGLDNLKEFTVCVLENQFIETYAPSVRCFDYSTIGVPNLHSSTFFDNLGHKFPRLEDLRLLLCCIERINVSSPSVKRISLDQVISLREINIDAPSMVSFQLLNVSIFPNQIFINASSQWVSKISTSENMNMDNDQFDKLEFCLVKLIKSKISLVLKSSLVNVTKNISKCSMVEVEDVLLEDVRFPEPSGHSYFVDALFLTCHPKVIIVTRNADVTQSLYMKLISKRNPDWLTLSIENKSWFQEIKEAKFEVGEINQTDWQPSNWDSFPKIPWKWERVCFRLEWKAQSSVSSEHCSCPSCTYQTCFGRFKRFC